MEQRRQYKTEFDNDFQEYRELHSKIDEVTARFQRLENELRNEEHNDRRYRVNLNRFSLVKKLPLKNDPSKIQDIQKQILKEYENTKDRRFQEQRQR